MEDVFAAGTEWLPAGARRPLQECSTVPRSCCRRKSVSHPEKRSPRHPEKRSETAFRSRAACRRARCGGTTSCSMTEIASCRPSADNRGLMYIPGPPTVPTCAPSDRARQSGKPGGRVRRVRENSFRCAEGRSAARRKSVDAVDEFDRFSRNLEFRRVEPHRHQLRRAAEEQIAGWHIEDVRVLPDDRLSRLRVERLGVDHSASSPGSECCRGSGGRLARTPAIAEARRCGPP